MAFLSLSPSSSFGQNSNDSLTPNGSELQEFALGQVSSAITVIARLSFDEPTQQNSGISANPPQAQPRPGNQESFSGAFTKKGGLSYGGGVRLGGAGVSGGVSAVGTTTLNSQGFQTSGGLTLGGVSANAGVKFNSGGLSFTGGLQKATAGQGILGPHVGSR
jgi:hypothetical protein